MQNFLINFKQNLIQIYTKTHQIAPFKKIIGGHAPNSLVMRMLSQSREKILVTPPATIMDNSYFIFIILSKHTL